MLAVLHEPLYSYVRMSNRCCCQNGCAARIIPLHSVFTSLVGLTARDVEGHVILTGIDCDSCLLQHLQRLANDHFGFEIMQHFNVTILLQ
ncbi:hypothetical protein D1872_245240 [compost metagenome]